MKLNVNLAMEENGPLRYALGVEDGVNSGALRERGVRLHQLDDRGYELNGQRAGQRAEQQGGPRRRRRIARSSANSSTTARRTAAVCSTS